MVMAMVITFTGNSPDACPNTAGFSKLDRFGCLDSDFDFYSDPDADYTVADGADALPNDGTQWKTWMAMDTAIIPLQQ